MSSDTSQATFPPEGNLSQNDPVTIVRTILTTGKTGYLLGQNGRDKKALYFAAGRPIGAKSNQLPETLLRLAHKLNVLDDAAFAKLLDDMPKHPDKKQGELMVAHGVPQKTVDALLSKQTALRYAQVMRWEQGRYRWDATLPERFPEWRVNPVQVFVELIKLRMRPELLKRSAKSVGAYRATIDEKLWQRFDRDIAADAVTKAVVDPLRKHDGKTLSQWMPQPGESREATKAWVAIYALQELGVLHFQAPASEASASLQPKEQAQTRPAESEDDDPELRELFEEMREWDYFRVLGLEEDADDRGVKRAYFQLAKRYHPDKYFDAERRRYNRSAERIFALINQAYEELKNKEHRELYLDFLKRGTTEEEETRRAEAILKSEVEFQKAQIVLRRKDYAGALEHLDTALDLHDEPEYRAYHNWVSFLRAYPDNRAQADDCIKSMRQLMAEGLNSADAWYFLGRMLKVQNELEPATEAFEKALKADSSHKDAAAELRRLEAAAKDQKVQQKQGLGKLFRK